MVGGTLSFVCTLAVLVCVVSCTFLPLDDHLDSEQYVRGNDGISTKLKSKRAAKEFSPSAHYTMEKRSHSNTCPLSEAGPSGSGMFNQAPSSLVAGNIGDVCTSAGIEEGNTCCQSSYFDLIDTPHADPFGTSALALLGESISTPCSTALSKFTCGICREHQDAFVQNFTSYSEVRLCLSYCQSLVTACNGDTILSEGEDERIVSDVYGTDAALFCNDLFANVENVRTSVTVDVRNDGAVSDNVRSFCYSDAKECTKDDFVPFYTECGHENQFRSVYYNFKDDECRGGHPLPKPKEELPCHQQCDSGSYLPVAATECIPCEAGTHSIAGYYNDQWKEWPANFNFKTYCEANNGMNFQSGVVIEDDPLCTGWVLNDSYVESGDTIQDSQQSVLELSIYLVTDGYVGFDYKVLSEPIYDGLFFFIDGLIALRLKSQVIEWEHYEVGMDAGLHVLKWMYFKDYSHGSNLDLAMIDKIFIVGTKWAGTNCDKCSLGHYSDPGADMCTKCPLNTYSDVYGASECKPCPDTQYSVVGSIECEMKSPCTEDAVVTLYSECDAGTRNKISFFSEPILCDTTGYQLPEDEEGIACADCNPGMSRPEGGSVCTFCEDGTYSADVGSTECLDCPAGTIARKTLLFTQFDNWEEHEGMTTDCQGDCSANGWRLLGDDIDSNIGHGALMDSNLYLDVELDTYGLLQWNFTLTCSHICRFQIIDVGVSGGVRTYYATDQSNPGPFYNEVFLTPGQHKLQWVFSKIDSTVLNAPNDRITIHGFTVFGVKGGGAIDCANCQAGYSSDAKSDYCTACLEGTYSEAGFPACLECEEGTFNADSAASSCKTCGAGTTSNEEKTDCDNNGCVFEAAPGVVYDLSSLTPTNTSNIFGPVNDKLGHIFYFSPCARDYIGEECYDSDLDAMSTHVCQKLPYGWAMDLGSVMGYVPFEGDKVNSGFSMALTEGSLGCANMDGSGNPQFPRSTNIDFTCNPNAGAGYPVAIEPVESPPCRYSFVWDSAFACPRCTLDDYDSIYGPCSGGFLKETFVPKTVPNLCTGGVERPQPREIACTISEVNCPAGKYLPIGSEDDECVDARPGHFSVGGAYIVDHFDSYDDFHHMDDGTWVMMGDFIRSAAGDTEFTANVFLMTNGFVAFEYKVYAPLLSESEAGFRFFVDGRDILTSRTTNFEYEHASFELPSGGHKLQWRFTGGIIPTDQDRGNYAIIDYIHVTGVSSAARIDAACRAGSYQGKPGQMDCNECPKNTYSDAGAEECTPCGDHEYSFAGASECEYVHACQGRDFTLRYGECDTQQNIRLMYHDFLQPQFCLFDELPFAINETIEECIVCPAGYILGETGICEPCELGQTYNKDTKKCEAVLPGTVSILTKTYFPTELSGEEVLAFPASVLETNNGFPEGFETASMIGNIAWRVLNNSIESGYHSTAENDSILKLRVNLLQPGSITFKYYLNALRHHEPTHPHQDLMLDGLQFYIDGEVQVDRDVMYHPPNDVVKTATFALPNYGQDQFNSEVEFMWVYHQPSGSRHRNRIILSDIEVVGDSRGTSLSTDRCLRGTYSSGALYYCEPCPLGHFAAMNGAGRCQPCLAGHFSDVEGAAECEPCGHGTDSTPDRTECSISTCVFTNGEQTWDLSGLSKVVILEDEDEQYRHYISICDKVPPQSFCFGKDNDLLNTYACTIDLSNGVANSTGRIANVFYGTDHIELHYNKGSLCGPPSSSREHFTDVTVICDMNETRQDMTMVIASETECGTRVEWRNIAGCRVCVEEDYSETEGKCEDGKQTVTYVKIAESICNGPGVISQNEQDCDETYPATLPIVLSSLGLFVILLCVIIVVAIRNKKLAERYEMLVNESISQRGSGEAPAP